MKLIFRSTIRNEIQLIVQHKNRSFRMVSSVQ